MRSSIVPPPGAWAVEQGFDLLLLLVDELPARAEELDAVVLGRVVRRRDDDAELVGEERDRRGREHAAEDGDAAGRGDAARDRLLELGAGAARVASDQDSPAAAPERRRLPDPLDELGRQVGADDATHPVCSEVAPSHADEGEASLAPNQSRSYRFENWGALRALCRPAFLRSTMRASRVRKPWRFSGTRISGSASTSARAMPCRIAPA